MEPDGVYHPSCNIETIQPLGKNSKQSHSRKNNLSKSTIFRICANVKAVLSESKALLQFFVHTNGGSDFFKL